MMLCFLNFNVLIFFKDVLKMFLSVLSLFAVVQFKNDPCQSRYKLLFSTTTKNSNKNILFLKKTILTMVQILLGKYYMFV